MLLIELLKETGATGESSVAVAEGKAPESVKRQWLLPQLRLQSRTQLPPMAVTGKGQKLTDIVTCSLPSFLVNQIGNRRGRGAAAGALGTCKLWARFLACSFSHQELRTGDIGAQASGLVVPVRATATWSMIMIVNVVVADLATIDADYSWVLFWLISAVSIHLNSMDSIKKFNTAQFKKKQKKTVRAVLVSLGALASSYTNSPKFCPWDVCSCVTVTACMF